MCQRSWYRMERSVLSCDERVAYYVGLRNAIVWRLRIDTFFICWPTSWIQCPYKIPKYTQLSIFWTVFRVSDFRTHAYYNPLGRVGLLANTGYLRYTAMCCSLSPIGPFLQKILCHGSHFCQQFLKCGSIIQKGASNPPGQGGRGCMGGQLVFWSGNHGHSLETRDSRLKTSNTDVKIRSYAPDQKFHTDYRIIKSGFPGGGG